MGRVSSNGVPRSLIVLSVISLALFVLGVREGDSGLLHGVRGVFQTVATPARVVGSVVASPVSGISNVVGNLTADSQTLSDLKAENDDLKAQVARLTEYEDEANTLTDLLQLRNQYNLDSTAARVIARSTDSWSSTITIDKGTTSGIQTGMPVMTSTGVVGQVSECGPTTATVRLITDESSGVSAKVQSSGAQGQLQGSADGTLHLNLIRTDQQVSTGDSVVTSGLGGVYPKGLPVGTVSNVTKSSGSLYYDITVEPLASVGSLEEVLVVTSLSGDQQATADDATAANAQDRTTSTSATTAAATTDAAASDSSDQTDSSSSE
ncbi:rod shape-determining protein MreC [uncultured Parolsenella sp.]|uniref:rod shape-determining protein MreC n=1 Tax=uncultured Parolsenella sp. TaxID=2083008 RepID=UPI0025CE7088|nr:rod shape-determining protein MreC [uncultured Parolsenella sp.]